GKSDGVHALLGDLEEHLLPEFDRGLHAADERKVGAVEREVPELVEVARAARNGRIEIDRSAPTGGIDRHFDVDPSAARARADEGDPRAAYHGSRRGAPAPEAQEGAGAARNGGVEVGNLDGI